MNETKQTGTKWKVVKKLCLFVGLPLFICILIYAWFFTYNLPSTLSSFIKKELNKYDFGDYSIEAIAVRHNKAVLGPISFGKEKDQLKIAQVQLNYSFDGIQNGEVESIVISGADLHLNRHGQWQLAGLEGILRGIANYQKANPSEGNSKIPLINVETSLLTLHYHDRQYSFPLSISVREQNERVIFELQTNLSRDHLQTFTFELDPETLSLDLKLDSFNLDITQASHFLQKFGMRDSKGSISATDISLKLSQKRFDIAGKIQIQNFKTIYTDEDKPVTLTFDKFEPVSFSRNLKDDKDVFADTLHFHNLAYSYGTYLFNAKEIKSKLYFDLSSNIYKTDSLIKSAIAQIDGSKIKSLSEIALKLNWGEGDLQDYSAKGEFGFSYSGEIVKGITSVNVKGLGGSLEAKGEFKDLIIPDGAIQSGSFTYNQQETLLALDVNAQNFSLLSKTIKGDSSFIYKKEKELVTISGSLNNLTLFERFMGNANLTIKESKDALTTSLKDFSFKTKEGDFEIALGAELRLPVSFDEFVDKPLKSTFTASTSVSHLKISDTTFKPFTLTSKGDSKMLKFDVDKFEPNELPILVFSGLSGSVDLNKKKAEAQFETQLGIRKQFPNLKGKVEAISMAVAIQERDGVLDLEFKGKTPESFFSYEGESLKFEAAAKHESKLKASIPLSDFFKSELSSFESFTQLSVKEFKIDQVEINETSLELKLATNKAIGLNNYLELALQGSLKNTMKSMKVGLRKSTKKEMANLQLPQWKEEFILQDLSLDLPFHWQVRQGFDNSAQKIKIQSLSHSRWVDGGDFLGYFPKKVSIENIALTSIFKGLQMELREKIKLNDEISIDLQLLSGWKLPEAVLSGLKSPLPFLTQVILLPEHNFKSSGSIKMGDTEITDLMAFIKEPISEDNILKGKVSAEVNFLKDKQGFLMPAIIDIKNTRGYFVAENDSYVKVKGLRGKLKFKSLLDFESEDGQYLRVDFFEAPGLKLDKTVIKYKMYSPEKIRIMRLDTTWCKGQIEGADILFNPAHISLKSTIYASKVEMEELMKMMKGVDCKANGTLYGRLNLEIRNGKVMNQDGFLFSEPGTKMSLQMEGDNVIYNSITDERTKKLLSNLDVEYFKILFKGGEDIDKHKTIFNLKGASAVGDPPNPLDLSINFNGPVIYYLQLPLHEQGIKDFIENKTKEQK